MLQSRSGALLRLVLVSYGVLSLGLFLLMRVWPTGWRWTPYDSSYEHMLIAVYATLGMALLLAARRPERHRSLILFTGWSSLVHAGAMAIDAGRNISDRPHLWGDVPLLALGGVLLLVFAPPWGAGGET